MPKKYVTPEAFKTALEQRIRQESQSKKISVNRVRQLLIFDRFLVRLFSLYPKAMLIKGGMALELRTEQARSTKDIDLRTTGSKNDFFQKLEKAASHNVDDFFLFNVEPNADQPEMTGEGVVYEGLRFHVCCFLNGKIYGSKFGVDISFGDPIIGTPKETMSSDFFRFAEIKQIPLLLYPLESHIAEKLHAYTLPRTQINSRVKDLPDLALLATEFREQAASLLSALNQTFAKRSTHPLPSSLPAPPTEWKDIYKLMAENEELPWPTLDEVFQAVQNFLDPVLQRQQGQWNPDAWLWKPEASPARKEIE